jgi:hypothetical protein
VLFADHINDLCVVSVFCVLHVNPTQEWMSKKSTLMIGIRHKFSLMSCLKSTDMALDYTSNMYLWQCCLFHWIHFNQAIAPLILFQLRDDIWLHVCIIIFSILQ